MVKKPNSNQARLRRHARVRRKISGTAARPRLNVFRSSKHIYAQIIDTYRSQISSGVLQNGDRLPSVRELASQLAINPNTIQRAYRELEMAGWIATVPGKG